MHPSLGTRLYAVLARTAVVACIVYGAGFVLLIFGNGSSVWGHVANILGVSITIAAIVVSFIAAIARSIGIEDMRFSLWNVLVTTTIIAIFFGIVGMIMRVG